VLYNGPTSSRVLSSTIQKNQKSRVWMRAKEISTKTISISKALLFKEIETIQEKGLAHFPSSK